jgi:SAM-dependent methyltransferase
VPEDLYAGFADRYDLFLGQFGEHDPGVRAFFGSLFRENGVRSVLDCACGTGNDLVLFHSLGCEVVGSDISPSMLAQARRNLAGLGLELPLHQVDYRHLPECFGRTFDAVVCLSSAILHMPDETEASKAFRSMAGVLRPGGILVLTQGTSDRQWREKPRFLLALDNEEVTRLFVIDYEGQGARYNILDIGHRQPGGELKVWSADYPRVLLRDDYARLLPEAGFASVCFYGGYGFEPYDKEESRRLIVVAKRGVKEEQ